MMVRGREARSGDRRGTHQELWNLRLPHWNVDLIKDFSRDIVISETSPSRLTLMPQAAIL